MPMYIYINWHIYVNLEKGGKHGKIGKEQQCGMFRKLHRICHQWSKKAKIESWGWVQIVAAFCAKDLDFAFQAEGAIGEL